MRMTPRAKLTLFLLFALLFHLAAARRAFAREYPLPILPGLEGWVEFWKQVFTRYGASELIFHDPSDPAKIYQVVEAAEYHSPRRLVEQQRRKIAREYGLEDEKKVRAQRGVKERFASGLALSRKYLDQMQRIFQDEGLPVELAYLPLVESSFNIHARSRAGALGLWQFMPSTGRQYLRITTDVDERRDPLESTRAAARLLKSNYELFGNWPLAVTAYNHGREGIQRAIAEVGSSDLMEIIRRYQGRAFGFASKSFYAEFLAALEVARRSDELFPNLEYHRPFPLGEIELGRSISIAALLKPTGTSQEQFHEWNPALSAKVKDIPSGYRIKVPADKLEIFLAAYQGVGRRALAKTDVPLAKGDAVSWIRHQVAPGETLSQIAESYQTSVGELQRVNGLGSAHLIAAGQHLKVRKR